MDTPAAEGNVCDSNCPMWKERQQVYMVTNTDPPPAGGNVCDSNCPVKRHIMERYNQHMGYTDNSDHMPNNYSMSRRTFKWNMKMFVHLLDLRALNS